MTVTPIKIVNKGALFFEERFAIWQSALPHLKFELLAETEAQQADWVFLPFDAQLMDYPFVQQQKEIVMDTGFVDVLVKKQNKFWPDVILAPALNRAVVRKMGSLDISQYAYLAGDCALLLPSIVVLTELGYKKIKMVQNDQAKFAAILKQLRNRLFNIEITSITDADLTLQGNEASILINCATQKDASLLEDLSYLNFIIRNGVIVDFSGEKNQLHEECKNASQKMIEIREILSYWDYVFFESQSCVTEKFDKFQTAYKSFMESGR